MQWKRPASAELCSARAAAFGWRRSPSGRLNLSLGFSGASSTEAVCAANFSEPAHLSPSKPTDTGRYTASDVPGLSLIGVGRLHGWRVRITTPDWRPVDHARIVVDGGMPQHGQP